MDVPDMDSWQFGVVLAGLSILQGITACLSGLSGLLWAAVWTVSGLVLVLGY